MTIVDAIVIVAVTIADLIMIAVVVGIVPETIEEIAAVDRRAATETAMGADHVAMTAAVAVMSVLAMAGIIGFINIAYIIRFL